ncbi:Positive regulator of purine utilization [Diaporthe eres]|nr:Positive regulator of purine utilization [Diaporthe eres]
MSDEQRSPPVNGAALESSDATRTSRLALTANVQVFLVYIQSLEDRVAYLESRLAYRESLDFQSTSEDCPPMPPSERSSSRDPIEQVVSKSLDADVFYNTITTSNGQSLLRSLLAEPIRSVSQTSKPNDNRALLDELPSLQSSSVSMMSVPLTKDSVKITSTSVGWLLWAWYTLERNLCVVVGRPFSIPDEAIHMPLPELAEGDGNRALALHLVKHRRLQSEIYTTLNQKPPVNGAALDLFTWRDGMRRRVIEWPNSAPTTTAPSTQLAPAGIFSSILHIDLVLLPYYPAASFPEPSQNDILIIAQSAVECISNYRSAFRDGQLRFFWRTTHNLFRSGVAMAYCVHLNFMHHYPDLSQADIIASINTCMSVLWAMVELHLAKRRQRPSSGFE